MVWAQAMAACSVTRRNSRERSDSMASSRLLHEPDLCLRATAEAEARGGVAGVHSDLEMIGAAKQCTQFTSWRFRVGGDDPRDLTIADGDPDRLAVRELFERSAIDVRDQVTEPVDAHHFAGDVILGHLRSREIDDVVIRNALPHRYEGN